MEKETYQTMLGILNDELQKALGCTEPIAIALAAAKAREVLGEMPESVQMVCSVNVFKNARCVTVPNSGGMKGIYAAAVLGILGGDASRGLEVLTSVTQEHRDQASLLLQNEFVSCKIAEDVENLYISVHVQAGEHTAEVVIANAHTSIVKMIKDGETLFEALPDTDSQKPQKTEIDQSKLTVKSILEFAEEVDLKDVAALLDMQITCNVAISEEGLQKGYGAHVGQALLSCGSDVRARAKARAAAGSDARMSGCSMPVVINSGSGNQGLTVTLPVLTYAEHLHVSQETLYRALVIANLISVHQKSYLGKLSAFCGAVTAASGAGAGITYLYGGTYEQICGTIVNTLASIGGMVCDGAKPSCAAKISAALDAALTAVSMSLKGCTFQDGEGLVKEDIETTIRSVGCMGRVGMRETDHQILKIMMDEVAL